MTIPPYTLAGHIVAAVLARCSCGGVRMSGLDLLGRRRAPEIVAARELVWWLLRTHTSLSFPEIARYGPAEPLDGRDGRGADAPAAPGGRDDALRGPAARRAGAGGRGRGAAAFGEGGGMSGDSMARFRHRARRQARVARSVGALPWEAVAAIWNYKHPDDPLATRTVRDIGQGVERKLREQLAEYRADLPEGGREEAA